MRHIANPDLQGDARRQMIDVLNSCLADVMTERATALAGVAEGTVRLVREAAEELPSHAPLRH